MDISIFEPIRQSIIEQVSTGTLPAFVVAAARGGKVLWREALGWADREQRVPAALDTLFPVASVSKSITATGMMILVERGLVDLDAPVTRYLPRGAFAQPQEYLEQVTVRHLLNMNSGIPHLWKYDYRDEADARRTTAQLVRRHGFTAVRPGKDHQYSNLAYGIVELVIAQAAGQSFADFMRAELFTPLGMHHTGLKLQLSTQDRLATAYTADNHPAPWDFSLGPDGGAGFYSTGNDLLRYCLFHLKTPFADGSPVLPPAALDRLHQEPDPRVMNCRINPIATYTMGWGVVRDGKYVSWWSNGAMLGGCAMLLIAPEEGTAVVCLTNYTSPDAISDQKAIEITGALLPDFAENLRARMAEVEEAERQAAPDPRLSGAWTGAITLSQGALPLVWRFTPDQRGTVTVGSQPEAALEEMSSNAGMIEGRVNATLPFEETLGRAHNLYFALRLEGDKLAGIARAESTGERPHFGLPFPVSLRKTDKGS
jgi:CubicO group peptidase (beta-lactamase class C family)